MDARQRISINLKRLRKGACISQERAAELAGFHRTYVSQLERCVANITIDGLERLSRALQVDIADLLHKGTVEEHHRARVCPDPERGEVLGCFSRAEEEA